jgi:hypothetical protein
MYEAILTPVIFQIHNTHMLNIILPTTQHKRPTLPTRTRAKLLQNTTGFVNDGKSLTNFRLVSVTIKYSNSSLRKEH